MSIYRLTSKTELRRGLKTFFVSITGPPVDQTVLSVMLSVTVMCGGLEQLGLISVQG